MAGRAAERGRVAVHGVMMIVIGVRVGIVVIVTGVRVVLALVVVSRGLAHRVGIAGDRAVAAAVVVGRCLVVIVEATGVVAWRRVVAVVAIVVAVLVRVVRVLLRALHHGPVPGRPGLRGHPAVRAGRIIGARSLSRRISVVVC